MSVVPGLPQRTARSRSTGAVVIPFPAPASATRSHRRHPARRPVCATRPVRAPLRLTSRGRMVVTVLVALAVVALLTTAASLVST